MLATKQKVSSEKPIIAKKALSLVSASENKLAYETGFTDGKAHAYADIAENRVILAKYKHILDALPLD